MSHVFLPASFCSLNLFPKFHSSPWHFITSLDTCLDLELRKCHCVMCGGLSCSQAELCGVPAPWGPQPVLLCAAGAAPSSSGDTFLGPFWDLQVL